MIKEAIGVADTIEEAKEAALLQLNVGDDADVEFEVLAFPKKKTLGLFGGSKAEVKVSVNLPDEKPAARRKPEKPAAEKPKKEVRPVHPAAKTEKTEKAEKPAKTEPVEKAAAPEAPVRKEELPYGPAVDVAEIAADTPAGRACAYLQEILKGLQCTGLEIKVAQREGGAMVCLSGEKTGILIGRRGETLDALQYLCSLAANNGNGYYKITLDVGNYREKREATLTALAKRVCAKAIATGRSQSLEPMNPYERRIIHTAAQAVEGVTSNSVGEGTRRHIVIYPQGGARRDFRGGFDRERRGFRNDHRDRRPASSNRVVPADRSPKQDNAELPLYGKIK